MYNNVSFPVKLHEKQNFIVFKLGLGLLVVSVIIVWVLSIIQLTFLSWLAVHGIWTN